jgi:hypothetical protein
MIGGVAMPCKRVPRITQMVLNMLTRRRGMNDGDTNVSALDNSSWIFQGPGTVVRDLYW